MYNSGSNETGGVEVDSEVQSRTNAGAATAFAVLGWLANQSLKLMLRTT